MFPSKLHCRYIFTYVFHFCVLNNTFIILLGEKKYKKEKKKKQRELKP